MERFGRQDEQNLSRSRSELSTEPSDNCTSLNTLRDEDLVLSTNFYSSSSTLSSEELGFITQTTSPNTQINLATPVLSPLYPGGEVATNDWFWDIPSNRELDPHTNLATPVLSPLYPGGEVATYDWFWDIPSNRELDPHTNIPNIPNTEGLDWFNIMSSITIENKDTELPGQGREYDQDQHLQDDWQDVHVPSFPQYLEQGIVPEALKRKLVHEDDEFILDKRIRTIDSVAKNSPVPVTATRELLALRYKIHTQFFSDSVVHQRNHLHNSMPFDERWKWIRRIGEGGQGEVYLEAQEKTAQLRAVKKISQHLMRAHSLKIERELDTLIAVNTYVDHFVHFLGWYENKDFIYLAMEYVPYGDLGQYLKEHPAESRRQAQSISKQLLIGIKILHEKQICHRDMKPKNVLVAKLSPIQVKIADFGISKCTIGTQLRTKHGTTNYMAPELLGLLPRSLRSGSQYTNAIDMWALGCLIHEILTSTIPFQDRDSETEYSGVTTSGYTRQLDTFTLSEFCKGSLDLPIEILSASRVTEAAIDFITRLLVVNPRSRMSASDSLKHEWLND